MQLPEKINIRLNPIRKLQEIYIFKKSPPVNPVVGDPLYAPESGKNKFGLTGQCLHAKKLGIVHPTTGEYMEFESELPEHFTRVLSRLRENNL